MIFELVVVDTKEQARTYPVKNEHNHVQKAIFVGQLLCGVHYRGQRPNKITRLHKPFETELEREWESEMLIKALDRRVRNLYKEIPTLDELLERCTDDTRHEEIDFGTVGNELI